MRFKNKERLMYKFKTEPYEHQKDALKKCWNKESFAIFAEMGTGKTKIALDNACILYNKGRGGFCQSPFPNYFTSISRGFFSSGITRSSSIRSNPFSRLAPLTTISSASVNLRSNFR